MNVLTWAKANPAPAAIAGGGALGLLVLLRAKSKPAGGAPTLVPAATANTTATDVINTLQPEIDALASIVNRLPTGPPVSPPPPLPGITPPQTPWSPPLYPDRRAGMNPPAGTCPAGHSLIQHLAEGWWSCMLDTQFQGGVAPAGTTLV